MIILFGPSACGKTEVAKDLAIRYNIKKVVTHTTREKRVNEVNDIDYHFVTKEEFILLKNKDFFVETAEYNNNFYGSSKAEIQNNKCCILEPAGVLEYKKLNDDNIVIFFLNASKETREKRMQTRQDLPQNITSRLINDEVAFKDKEKYADFIISTENRPIKEITDEVYNLYLKKIKK